MGFVFPSALKRLSACRHDISTRVDALASLKGFVQDSREFVDGEIRGGNRRQFPLQQLPGLNLVEKLEE